MRPRVSMRRADVPERTIAPGDVPGLDWHALRRYAADLDVPTHHRTRAAIEADVIARLA